MVVENINAVVLPKPTHTHTHVQEEKGRDSQKDLVSHTLYIYVYLCEAC